MTGRQVSDAAPPTAAVRAGFGARGDPVLLDGGQGRTWRCGDVILKPAGDPAESNWRADVLHRTRVPASIRIARPVPPVDLSDGVWVVDGWEAWEPVAGAPDPGRLDEVLRAATSFHAMVAGLRRPVFLDGRDDAWTFGERVAFGELPVPDGTEWTDPLRELVAARRPVAAASYAVHGDLLGNVLFAPGLAPAVIDWAVYFRPVSWAHAVAEVDAVTWGHVPPARLRRPADPRNAQMLLRALIYRMATNVRAGTERPADYRAVHAAVLAQVERAGEVPEWFLEKTRRTDVTSLWINTADGPGPD